MRIVGLFCAISSVYCQLDYNTLFRQNLFFKQPRVNFEEVEESSRHPSLKSEYDVTLRTF